MLKKLFVLLLAFSGCVKVEEIKSPYTDNFERKDVGTDYSNTGGPYEISDGKLNVKGAYNHPLWLKRRLPRNAEISFDVTSKTLDGDIKVEAWGDGETFAENKGAYLASSYVFIFGGWGNRIAALCRMDEHDPNRIQRQDRKVELNKTYHWRIRRKGTLIEWFVDGELFLKFDDKAPLEGNRHSYFGFNNWESDLYFDNLEIKPL